MFHYLHFCYTVSVYSEYINILLQICWFFRLLSLPHQHLLELNALTLIAAGLNNGDNAAQNKVFTSQTLSNANTCLFQGAPGWTT
jgi:hypothetical protein